MKKAPCASSLTVHNYAQTLGIADRITLMHRSCLTCDQQSALTSARNSWTSTGENSGPYEPTLRNELTIGNRDHADVNVTCRSRWIRIRYLLMTPGRVNRLRHPACLVSMLRNRGCIPFKSRESASLINGTIRRCTFST
jgi:hypothetical protein